MPPSTSPGPSVRCGCSNGGHRLPIGPFALDAATTASVIDICRRLDGNALAIEMAAAWAPLVGLGELKRRLVERLRLFTTANRSLPSRQRSLRATLDWSHSLLGPTEQRVLRRLSVFVGSIRLELAQQVASSSGEIDDWTVLEALRTLVDRSLIQVEPVQPPRYRLLESVRLYAGEQLVAAGETAAVERRHGEAFARLAIALRDDYRALSHPEFLDLYGADQADMDAAFNRACERRDATTGAVTGAALIYLAAAFGVNTEMRRLQKAAYDLLPAATEPLDRALLWRQVATAARPASPTVPRLLAARESLEAARVLGDVRGTYVALAALSAECARSADFEGARAAAAQARAIEDYLPGCRDCARSACGSTSTSRSIRAMSRSAGRAPRRASAGRVDGRYARRHGRPRGACGSRRGRGRCRRSHRPGARRGRLRARLPTGRAT